MLFSRELWQNDCGAGLADRRFVDMRAPCGANSWGSSENYCTTKSFFSLRRTKFSFDGWGRQSWLAAGSSGQIRGFTGPAGKPAAGRIACPTPQLFAAQPHCATNVGQAARELAERIANDEFILVTNNRADFGRLCCALNTTCRLAELRWIGNRLTYVLSPTRVPKQRLSLPNDSRQSVRAVFVKVI